MLEGFHLSPQQRRRWKIDSIAGARQGSGCVLEIRGDQRRVGAALGARSTEELAAGLRAALGKLQARHEILRTRYQQVPGMAVPIQQIDEEGRLDWEEEPLSVALGGAGGANQLDKAVEARWRALLQPAVGDEGPQALKVVLLFDEVSVEEGRQVRHPRSG